MAVSPEKGIDQPEQQAMPKGETPTKRETANAEHGDNLVRGCRAHDFTVYHPQPTTPEKQFVNEKQNEGSKQHTGLPMVKRSLVKSKLPGEQSEEERCTRYEDSKPEGKQAQHHGGTA